MRTVLETMRLPCVVNDVPADMDVHVCGPNDSKHVQFHDEPVAVFAVEGEMDSTELVVPVRWLREIVEIADEEGDGA